ncbi:MAG TPA: DoxX family protein [Puia sp.]|uniref:DoxX family protein n=1 Tax=Puia sp. TaxID=2045100 RepID=UPI002CE8889A|nr:DoxX family protein [Puia sp.]HVU96411.1 DoxX family protein [Puia sp.]
MTKTKIIIYWVFTLWASLGLTATAIQQVFNTKGDINFITHLGYPNYSLVLIGIWKLLAVPALLIPGFAQVKEWTYAGLFFLMTGAIFSHLAMSDRFKDLFPSLLLSAIIFLSWYFRPANRRLAVAHS